MANNYQQRTNFTDHEYENETFQEFFNTSVNQVHIAVIFEIFLSIAIVFGNLFVLALFYQERKTHHISHKYIISMAVSDLMQGAFNGPLLIYCTYDITVGSTECFWSLIVGTIFALSSFINIVATSIDRYWAIVHPFSYKAKATHRIAVGK